MTTVAAPTEYMYTPECIARLSRETGKHYELFGGELVEKRVSMRTSWLAGQVGSLLHGTYPPSRAYVFIQQPIYCFSEPGEMRKPDVALVWAERFADGLDDDELYIPPDLVVEVVSPSNTFSNRFQRVENYLSSGVPVVWVVDPPLRWVHVYRRDGSTQLLRAADTLRDEAHLPGLALNVADFFPPVAAVAGGQ